MSNYLHAYKVGQFVHLYGLVRVNTELPINSNWIFLSQEFGSKYGHSFAANSQTDGKNIYTSWGAGSNHGTNTQQAFAVGTYIVDTWWTI